MDLPARQESTRTVLAIAAAAIFLVTLVGAFVLADGPNWANAKDLLDLFVPIEATILGAAVGFYFGTKQ